MKVRHIWRQNLKMPPKMSGVEYKARKNSGFVEGLNNKIKVMKRRCYGLWSVESYFQRLWLDLKGYAAYGL